jgi:hypothetical protein
MPDWSWNRKKEQAEKALAGNGPDAPAWLNRQNKAFRPKQAKRLCRAKKRRSS